MSERIRRTIRNQNLDLLLLLANVLASAPAFAGNEDNILILNNLHTVTQVASTTPANGDPNPQGVAHVNRSVGNLADGDFLVTNFNNGDNLQGTGTTIVEISPNGSKLLFTELNPGGDRGNGSEKGTTPRVRGCQLGCGSVTRMNGTTRNRGIRNQFLRAGFWCKGLEEVIRGFLAWK
jgi:hypothetical protein